MRLSKTSGIAFRSFLNLAALAFLGDLTRAQILDIYSDSLTTYLPGATAVQGLQPQVGQRGVGIDGSLRAGPTFPMALAGNPYENAWVGHERQGSLRLDTGAWSPTEVDIALPAPGFSWVIGRTYSAVQSVTSDGPMGKNWASASSPEIVFYNDANNAKDALYLVYGADRFVEFVRATSTSNQFKARNGASGVFDYASGSPDTYVYIDPNGTQFTFFGFNTSGGTYDGQLWKITDTANNKAYVGDPTTASTAITNGFDGSGRVLKAYDTADRRYTYAYTSTSYGGKTRLESVIVETKTSGTWASPSGVSELCRVEYTYYGSSDSHGDGGDLQLVKTTMPLTDSGVTQVTKKLYRYWEGSSDNTSNYNSSTNPGYVHAIKYVYDSEGLRRYDYAGDATFDEDFLSASDDTLKPYAAAYFAYDSNHKVSKAWFNGQCGCGSSGNGEHEYTYDSMGATSAPGYDTGFWTRTVVEQPDGSFVTQYFDEVGQALSTVLSDGDPAGSPDIWFTHIVRDALGCVTTIHTPANAKTYTHSTATVGTPEPSAGLIRTFTRASSGDMKGFVINTQYREGTGGTALFESATAWTSATKTFTDVTVVRPLVDTTRAYSEASTGGGSGYDETDYSYSNYPDETVTENKNQSLVQEVVTTTLPTVSSGKNGPNSAAPAWAHYRKDRLVDFAKEFDGTITYRDYTNGKTTLTREDALTTSLTPPASPVDFASTAASPLDRQTEVSLDALGMMKTTITPKGASVETKPFAYRSRLKDQRLVTIDFPHCVTSGTATYYGPARFTVINHAGKVEASGLVKLTSNQTTAALTAWVDETDDDPITALDLGAVGQLTTNIYDESGAELQEMRQYFAIPASGVGSDSANYDPTTYGYDDLGRQRRVKEACGTIRRSVRDAIGRQTETWVGTNDSSFAGGESSGTDNMTKTEFVEYDAGSDKANGLVTTRTLRVEATSTGERVTQYTYDVRGLLLLQENPTAPHVFHKYDNRGRQVATGLFSSVASINLTSDDPTTETANRLALTETFYDEQGRVWKTNRHEIDASDGSDDDHLDTLNWYDEDGRLVKVDGPELKKMAYDSLGRLTDEYVLAKDNDSAYAHVLDVAGDIVLEERQTRYDGARNDVVLTVQIDRWHDDKTFGAYTETTGKLDGDGSPLALPTVASGTLKGRAHITAAWFDAMGRVTDRVEYGDYAKAAFNRSGLSVPSRSDTALRTSYVYNEDATTKSIEDPRGLKSYFTYDALGRRTSEVKNWDGTGSPTPSGSDDNVTVRYEYTDGLRTKLIADLPSGQTDQVTTYIYGSVKGTPSASKLASGHMLRAVLYPDTANTGDDHLDINSDASDVVSSAYNARGQETYRKDQAGNVFESDFDTSGRVLHKRVTTLASGFDGAVRRISTAYDGLGRMSTVTQYDNATAGSGSAVDEVKYTYDGWSDLLTFEQDRDSTVGASGSVNDYEVSYAYETKTTGRNTIRRTSMTLPSSKVITYHYLNREGGYDNACSRVTDIKDGAVYLAAYDYNGVGRVAGTQNFEPDIMSNTFDPGSTQGDYAALDRFDRVLTSRWTKDLSTDVDFCQVEFGYDRDSSITSAADHVHSGFDALYSMDDTNRLTRAEEGTLAGGSITSRTRDQQWTLSQTGNWNVDKVDLNGDGDFTDTNELNDTRVHNAVNELATRDTDSNSSTNYTLAYDDAGNMTDDGEDYKYVYDAFNRLRKIKDQSNDLVAEFRYNGLGYKIGVHEDTDTDGDVDGSDLWYYDAFDERWRQVSRFRGSDAAPKEEFVAHQAGNDGRDGSSYIDLVVCRYKDADTDWVLDASDGVLEERLYYCQNWRADVSAIVGADGTMKEWVKYSAYGIPYLLPAGDAESNGGTDSGDYTVVDGWYNAPSYDVRGDVDLDADIDSYDLTAISALDGTLGGIGLLSSPSLASFCGHAGAQACSLQPMLLGHRRRTRDMVVGSWMTRDAMQYSDGLSLYEFVASSPLARVDPLGLKSIPPGALLASLTRCEPQETTTGYSSSPSEYYLQAECTPLQVGLCGPSGFSQECKWQCIFKVLKSNGSGVQCPTNADGSINRSKLSAPENAECNKWHGGEDTTVETVGDFGKPPPPNGKSEFRWRPHEQCGSFATFFMSVTSADKSVTVAATILVNCEPCMMIQTGTLFSFPPPRPPTEGGGIDNAR